MAWTRAGASLTTRSTSEQNDCASDVDGTRSKKVTLIPVYVAIRIILMNLSCQLAQPVANRLQQKPRVEAGDEEGDRPRQRLDPRRVRELGHFASVTREHHQRKYGEAELHAQHHLAQDKQTRGPALPPGDGHDDRGHDRDQPRDQAAQPWREAA